MTATLVHDRQAGRSAVWQARLLALAVFGPYVAGSARTEQVAILALAAWVLVTGWPRLMHARFASAPFLVTWGGAYAVMVISTIWRPFDPMFYGSLPASHALAAMALPLAMLVITWYWSAAGSAVSVLRAAAPVVIAGMCANTVLEVVQLAAGKADALGWLPRFWDAAPSAGSVAASAAGNGRYTGIFNQPAEAGVAFGVALLLLIWLARQERRPVLVTAAAVLLITGGVLTVSKVFLLCALPVAVVTVLRGRARVRVVVTAAACACAVFLAGAAGLLPSWALGARSLGGLARPGTSLAAQYSAGRYGSGGTLAPVTADVLHSAPLAGFGAGGLAGPAYDSLWQQVLVVSGVLGLILAAAFAVLLAWRTWRLRLVLARPDWHLAAGTLVVALGASQGIPSLTANRAGTLLWLVLGLLVAAKPDPRGIKPPGTLRAR